MRITALALIVSLFSLSASDAFALSTVAATAAKVDQEHLQWQKVAEAIPLGTKVKVQTLDGKRVSGTLLSVNDKSVQVKRHTRRPEAAVTVRFDNISNLERDSGGGMNWAKALGIGIGAGAGVFLTIFVIALQLD